MADALIERMATDLGITAYKDESETEFAYRVSYSAISLRRMKNGQRSIHERTSAASSTDRILV